MTATRILSFVGLACAVSIGGASAQNTAASGLFGTVALTANFTPDPHRVRIEAGGADAASALGSPCVGFIASGQPDYELNYTTSGAVALGFFVQSAVDTTLVINDPSGRWYCNDDFNARGGENAGIVFPSAAAGSYDVWVGTYNRDDVGAAAELIISELGAPWDPRFGTTELAGDFNPDPFTAEVVAGGGDAAASLANGCVGFVSTARPDYDIVYSQAGRFTLSLFAEGTVDTTLAVRAPDGSWHCNDDFDATGHNPGVTFGTPVNGTYSVWVGVFEQGSSGQRVNLFVTETGTPPWQARSAAPGPARAPGTALSSSGTGFLVSRAGHVLTNHHVIEGCSRLTFQVRGDLAVEARILASNAGVDLALLKTDLTPVTPAEFAGAGVLRLGDEVVVYGFPLLGDLSSQGNLTSGIVSALSGLNDDLSRLQMTAQIQPGNSGGPVMDRTGHIAGVVVETLNTEFFQRERNATPQNVNFAVREAMARSFLDTNNVRYAVSTDRTLLPIADIAERAQQYTGLILCYQ
ncbi:MAG: trypsin-like peptidase domain-containing protein [Acidobacteria bacterium]|nr:trypsin-like peptidase domain-containing protein [Acidobacteriota bacterium]